MGGKESKQFPISGDEAFRRVTDQERRRMQDAFRNVATSSGHVTRQVFLRDVLGDGIPHSLADQIYQLCCLGTGGTSGATFGSAASYPFPSSSYSSSSSSSSSSSRGLTFREVLAVLVLITRGTREEKVKFVFGLLAAEGGTHVDFGDAVKRITEWEGGQVPESVTRSLFARLERVEFDEFSSWLEANADCTCVSRWLLTPSRHLSLVNNKTDALTTLYQTLAGVTHLEEQEIMELEQRFWHLAESNRSNRIDFSTVKNFVSPPFPETVAVGFFNALDENQDGHVDFKELSCGVSAACRGPDIERQKFCFKIFDSDRDGFLSSSEVEKMLRCMMEVRDLVARDDRCSPRRDDDEELNLLSRELLSNNNVVSIEEYLVWTVSSELAVEFAKVVYQLCHVLLGLRPVDRKEEGEIVRHWLEREEKAGLVPGSVWYLVTMDWWTQWHAYVNGSSSSSSLSLSKKKSASSSLAIDDSSHAVVGTSYQQIHDGVVVVATPQPSPFTARKLASESASSAARPKSIDNSGLVQPGARVANLTGEGGKLRSRPLRGKDFEIVPERLWKALFLWYGGSPVLPRQVILTKEGNVELELNPISVRLFRHHQQANRPSTAIPVGIGGGVSSTAASARRYHAYQAAFSRRTTVRQIEEFLSQRLGVKTEDLRLWKFCDDVNMRLLDEGTLEDAGFGVDADDDDNADPAILVETRSRDGTWPEEISSICGSGSNGSLGVIVAPTQVKGVTGLNNLGNTCYMNAAVQCVANTKILAAYFNGNCHVYELNRVNPLGRKGQVAKRFGDLVREMWSSRARSVAPIKLRWTIGHYNQSFAGFQQQDSQELLSFLLDGLHEDLNRVKENRYVELRDSDGRPDIVVAQEAEQNHAARNRSVIVDLFGGQLKSKVTCKVCEHESVKFDPFTFLSLPLPMESSVRIEVVVVGNDGCVPVKYGLCMDMEDKFSGVRAALAKLCNILQQNLLLVEIVQSQFRPMQHEEQKLKGMNGTCMFAYEVQPRSSEAFGKSQDGPKSLSDIQRSSWNSLRECSASSTRSRGTIPRQQDEGDSKVIAGEEGVEGKMEDQPDHPGNLSKPSTDKDALLLGGEEDNSPPSGDFKRDESRQNSCGSSSTYSDGHRSDYADFFHDMIVGLHRKMMPQESYFLSTEKYRPVLFGLPILIPCCEATTYQDLYRSVWVQVSRLVSPLPRRDASQNHATDCDDSLGYQYPFVLKVIQKGGSWCAWCPWHRFCRGCSLPCTEEEFGFAASSLAIDWDQTALHLRYLSAEENAFVEHESVQRSLMAATEHITLKKCLEVFTRQEELGEDEKYYCSRCKCRQPASKKLQIWRLPPVLIIHLKRFHFLNGRWIKSHKIVDFSYQKFDPTDYLAAVPFNTIQRYKELVEMGKSVRVTTARNVHKNCNGTIAEGQEAVEDDESSESNAQEEVFAESHPTTNDQIFSPNLTRRTRQQSTSLYTHPITDDDLQDFHQHKLLPGYSPLDIKYNLYSMVCHSGVMGGGHYIAYSKTSNGTWWCLNDSSCKEIPEAQMDKSTAYMLFFEREGLDANEYLPKFDSKPKPDTGELDEEFESDFKKQCSVM